MADSATPRAILWDLMDTLVWDPFRVLPDFFGMSMQQLLAEKDPNAWPDFERGAIDQATFFEHFFIDRRPVDGEALRKYMLASYRWKSGMRELLQDLVDRGVNMHALSNYPPWVHPMAQRLGLSRYLSLDFVSCETGARKPDAVAYRLPCERLDLAPGELLFIDDRTDNVDAARAIGMHGFVFRGDRTELRAELGKHGLLE